MASNFKHVMLDIETMGVSSNSAIMSVGACYFDPGTGEIGDTFYEKCSLKSCVDAGLEINTSTVLWWMKQSDEARSKFQNNETEQHVNELLVKLSAFINVESQVWGNGAAFDNVIIRNAYKKCLGFETPWGFWNDRDVRTIVEIGNQLGFNPKEDMAFEGVKHDALDDAKHQAKYVSEIWQRILKVKE